MANFYYAVGPYVTRTEGGVTYTIPPAGAIGIDLRSLAGHAALTYGLFWSEKPFSDDYRVVGRGDLRDITDAPRDVIASMFGLRTLSGDSLADMLWGLLTVAADPIGDDRAFPIMPTRRKHLELVLSGHGVIARKTFDPALAEAPVVQDLLRRQYRVTREAALAGALKDEVHHLRVLDAWVEKYGLAEEYFRPPDLPVETLVKHETTINESFNKADGALGPDLTWVDFHGSGVYEVVSNAAERVASAVGAARADSALSSDDHYAQAEFAALAFSDRSAGVMARQAGDATQTYYIAVADGTANGETWKSISGSYTGIGSQGGTFAVGDVIQLECDGSTIARKKNGTIQNSTTDTAISGNLYTGLASVHAIAGAPALDNFEAADLSAGATTNTAGITLSGALQSQRDLVATLDGALASQRSASAAINAAIARVFAESVTTDAALQKLNTIAATLNAALQVAGSVAVSTDAALSARGTQQSDLDAALADAISATLSLDGVLQATRSAAATLDAMLNSGSAVFSTLDAVLRQAMFAEITFGAALAANRTASATLDASLTAAGTLTITAAIDGALEAARSVSFTADAALSARRSASAAIDALLAVMRSAQADLDAVLAQVRTASADVDGALVGTLSASVTLSAQIGESARFAAAAARTFAAKARGAFIVPPNSRRH